MARKLRLGPGSLPRGQAQVHLPSRASTPAGELLWRVGIGLALLLVITVVVWLDRDSYADNIAHDGVSLIDALYYATVTHLGSRGGGSRGGHRRGDRLPGCLDRHHSLAGGCD